MKSDKAIIDKETESRSGSHLLRGCELCLNQCDSLLQMIDDSDYRHSEDRVASVGAHMRHILDRYHCFFNGLQPQCIDYDERKRDLSVESNVQAARFDLATVRRRCSEPALQAAGNQPLHVRETIDQDAPATTVVSTVERELMALVSHSIHHLAIIALLMKTLGYRLSADIGKAPSTLVHERR